MAKIPKEFKYIQAIILLAAALLYLSARVIPYSKNMPVKDIPVKDGNLYVERAVDGDTLKLSNGQRVRLIGVDTPEVYYSAKLLRDAKKTHRDIESIQELGKKASDFTKSLCNNKKVRLEFDVEKNDRYGRLLAYVYLDDGTFVNARILEEGYGQVMTIPPNVKYAGYFLKLQRQARDNKKGLWGLTDII